MTNKPQTVEEKFTDQFFASTEGRNDIRREQIAKALTASNKEAEIVLLERLIALCNDGSRSQITALEVETLEAELAKLTNKEK